MEITIVNGLGRRANAMPTLERRRSDAPTQGEFLAKSGFGPALREATLVPSVDPHPGLDSPRTL